jgi:hypothetical protein
LGRTTLIVGNRGLKRTSSSKGGEEIYIWREFYTKKFHKTHSKTGSVFSTICGNIYFKRMFIRKPDWNKALWDYCGWDGIV